ncbi:hypothetical protein WJX73_002282 [Symbiochloris irregularis]|uniref:Uncharacterized protein n=1 Tax=Symbiochloris irregularis TaxID=706552 RepID=A0AAW1NN19_9CHLO
MTSCQKARATLKHYAGVFLGVSPGREADRVLVDRAWLEQLLIEEMHSRFDKLSNEELLRLLRDADWFASLRDLAASRAGLTAQSSPSALQESTVPSAGMSTSEDFAGKSSNSAGGDSTTSFFSASGITLPEDVPQPSIDPPERRLTKGKIALKQGRSLVDTALRGLRFRMPSVQLLSTEQTGTVIASAGVVAAAVIWLNGHVFRQAARTRARPRQTVLLDNCDE